MSANPIIVEETYSAPIEKIWLALTSKEEMKDWYFDVQDFKPEVGNEFHFYEPGGTKYHHKCKILQIIPLQKLQHSWTYPDYTKGISIVSWELISQDGKTKVILTHENTDAFEGAGKDFTWESFQAGWKEILGTSLKKYVEQ